MSTLTITVRDLKALVDPVLPCAGKDDALPVLTAVHIKTHGTYIVATTSDRFRAAVHRKLAADGEWPDWEALVPVKTLRSIFAMFKPGRGYDPDLTLTLLDDSKAHNPRLAVEMAGGLDGSMFTDARVTYPLCNGDFPAIGSIISQAIAAAPEAGDRRFSWHFLADFKAADMFGTGLTMHAGPPKKPLLVTDGADFVGIIMPRRIPGAPLDGPPPELDLSDWAPILNPPAKPAPKPKRTRKKATAGAPS